MLNALTLSTDLTRSSDAWFGRTPTRWTILPARALFDEIKLTGRESEPMLSVTIRKGVIPQSDLLSDSSKKDNSNLDRSKYKFVEPGDIVYNKMRAWQGALGLSNHRGIVSPAYVVMRPRHGYGRFLSELMRTPAFAKEAERWSYGITSDMWSLRPEHFKMIFFPIAPADEQAAIVKYLRHAHSRIDHAIAAKHKLVALLEEQRQAIIHKVVTRGLDQAVPYKESGIPFLDEIPKSWSTKKLKSLISGGPKNGISPQITEDGDLETFSLSAIRGGRLDVRPSDLKYVSRDSVTQPDDYRLKAGDVLLVRGNGNIDLVGRAAEVAEDRPNSIYPDLIIRLRTKPEIDSRYLVMLINSPSVRRQVEVAARTAVGTFKINGENVKNLLIPVPALSEQIEIIEACEDRTKSIRLSINTSVREISLLREFRTRLTSEVVAGRVDVREIAAKLPELADDEIEGDEVLESDEMLETKFNVASADE